MWRLLLVMFCAGCNMRVTEIKPTIGISRQVDVPFTPGKLGYNISVTGTLQPKR